jgi:hypothetical protein
MNKYLSGGDVKQVKRIAKTAVKGHEKAMHGKGLAKSANQKVPSFKHKKSGGK